MEASVRDLLKELTRHFLRKTEESTKKLSQYNRCLRGPSMKNEERWTQRGRYSLNINKEAKLRQRKTDGNDIALEEQSEWPLLETNTGDRLRIQLPLPRILFLNTY
jgi:hypothetical protein